MDEDSIDNSEAGDLSEPSVSDTSESESDIDLKVAQDEIFDEQFVKCYQALKNKDPKIYDEKHKFFKDESDPVKIKTEKVTILDHQLKLPKEMDQPVPSTSHYEKELQDIKSNILTLTNVIDSDDEEFIHEKNKKAKPAIDIDCDGFLKDYIVNKRYTVGSYFSKNLDELPDVELDEKKPEPVILPDDLASKKLTRIPRNATSTIRDLIEKQEKKEKRKKKLEKLKKKKSSEDDVEDFFQYCETEPEDYGLTAAELLMVDDNELEKWASMSKAKREVAGMKEKVLTSLFKTESDNVEDDIETNQEVDKAKDVSKKKKKKRCLNHKKTKTGVAPDRLLAYGLSKNKLRKSKLLE